MVLLSVVIETSWALPDYWGDSCVASKKGIFNTGNF